MNSKPPEPQIVRAWRQQVRGGPPRCCHTCDWYRDDGTCAQYRQRVPDDFAARIDACPAWTEEIPF